MSARHRSRVRPLAASMRLGPLALLVACLGVQPLQASAEPASLHARHVELKPALKDSPFGHPMHIESREAADTVHGEVHAVLDHPFARVRDALRQPANWCDVLILPFNTTYCHAVDGPNGPQLLMRLGRKYDQPLHAAYRLTFDFRSVAATGGYFESRLSAPQGPVGTRAYNIVVSAVPLDDGRTFLKLGYSYGFGFAGKVAMQAYLATTGASKVGFTRTGNGAADDAYIGGMRGAVERNAMRYYLAIDAFLDSLKAPPDQQAEHRVQGWFDATERYPKQLREMDRATYVGMKRMEIERQQTLVQ
jgi:hypothetical protein